MEGEQKKCKPCPKFAPYRVRKDLNVNVNLNIIMIFCKHEHDWQTNVQRLEQNEQPRLVADLQKAAKHSNAFPVPIQNRNNIHAKARIPIQH
jgi:hypothetical protein